MKSTGTCNPQYEYPKLIITMLDILGFPHSLDGLRQLLDFLQWDKIKNMTKGQNRGCWDSDKIDKVGKIVCQRHPVFKKFVLDFTISEATGFVLGEDETSEVEICGTKFIQTAYSGYNYLVTWTFSFYKTVLDFGGDNCPATVRIGEENGKGVLFTDETVSNIGGSTVKLRKKKDDIKSLGFAFFVKNTGDISGGMMFVAENGSCLVKTGDKQKYEYASAFAAAEAGWKVD